MDEQQKERLNLAIKRRRRSSRRRHGHHYSLVCVCFFALLAIFANGRSEAGAVAAEEEATGPVVGIDLGTTYSCVGVFKNGKVDIISNDQGNRITPSYVAFTEKDRLVGDGAKHQAAVNPQNTIYDVKRLIGRHFSDKSVQVDKKLVPYTILPSSDDTPTIQVNLGSKLTNFSPEEVSAMVLQKMKTTAETALGEEIKRAVVTVPAYFTDAQKQATKDAATIAGLKVERLLTEPTAAAIAFGMDTASGGHKEMNVLVFDLGGGTFDVTVLTIDDGVFEVLATNGDTHLGGEDFDQRIMKYFMNLIKKQDGIDISKDKTALQKLRTEAERCKRGLSSQQTCRLEIDNLADGYDFSETLTRARFEEINSDLFKKTLEPVRQAMKDAKLSPNDFDDIVLVGGSTRIPKIQELVSELFGKQPATGVHPDEAVCLGASMQAAVLAGDPMVDHMIVLNSTPLSTGIETVGGVMTKIVGKGTTYPLRKTQTFSTNQDNQSTVTIQVFEGERAMTKDNHQLGRFELSGIPPAPRGVPQIEVTFEIDSDGILQVSAVDKGTGKKENVTITSIKGRLTEDEIDRMVKEAEAFADEDKQMRERIDAQNGLESYLFNLKNTLEDKIGTRIDPAAKKELEDLVDETMDWLHENPDASKDDFDEKQKDVEQMVNPILREIYSTGDGADSNDMDDFGDDEL